MTGRSRRRFLTALGALSTGVIAGCSGDTGTTTPVATETDTEEPTEEVTEEQVELPRVIGESEIPSFDSVYKPGEWAPENYENVMEGVDVSGIENEYDTRVGQVRNLLAEVMSSEEYVRDQHGAILASLNAVHELSWADEGTMFADDVTATSGGVGSMLELVFEDEGGELEHSAMIFGGEYTDPEDYIEDLPNSTYHDGNGGDWTFTEFDPVELAIENSGGVGNLSEEAKNTMNSGISNIAFGPNDNQNTDDPVDMDPVVVGRDYLQTMSEAIENDTRQYLEMKQELSQYLGAVEEGNALGASIQDGETVYEELDSETFNNVAPVQYNNW